MECLMVLVKSVKNPKINYNSPQNSQKHANIRFNK